MMEKPSPRLTTATTTGGIIIPRPKSVFSKRDAARLDDSSYQRWMQEYHRHQHYRTQQLVKASTTTPPTTTTPTTTTPTAQQHPPNTITKATSSPTNSISKKSKGSNLFLNFSSLKINPNDNINILKKNALTTTPIVDGKSEHQQTETLDGYRIYKGAGNSTMGISKQNTISSVSNSNDNQYHTVSDPTNGTVFSPYTPLILPDKFILAPGKSHGHDNKSSVRISAQQPYKQITTPFHIQLHPQRRPRPHSASIDFSSAHHSTSNRIKDNGKTPKHVLQTSYKAPTVTTIQLHSSEAIALTPRSIPPNKTSTTDKVNNFESKLEQQNAQPKSILKNHNDSTIPSPHTIQLGIANYSKTLPLSHQKVKHEFAYHELIVSPPGKNPYNVSPLTLSRHGSLNQQRCISQRASFSGTESRRPKSASATVSKYELIDRSSTPRRKSVTFNSYVSFSSDSRVSTIRALPVDV